MKLEELGRMSAKERLTWINTAKVQDLNTILKEAEIKGYSKMKKQEKIELVKELVAQEIRISGILKIEGLKNRRDVFRWVYFWEEVKCDID